MLKKIIFSLLILATVAFAAKITAFAAPDNSYEALSEFIKENDNFLIAVYTFDNYDIAKLLQKKNFTLIVDESPVGGMGNDEKFVLCTLNKGNVWLYQNRYYMHAKYAVSSSKVLVSTENFGYHGFPDSYGNRGFGVIVEDEEIARKFSDIFNEDIKKSRKFNCDGSYKISDRQKKIYQKKFSAEEFSGAARAVFAPNAVSDVVAFIDSANEKLYIAQLYIHNVWGTKDEPKENALLESAIDRARKGVEVKVLLDSSFFNIDEEGKSNKATANYINEIAKKENLNMEAKLIELNKLNLDELHGKLVISDNAVLVSSINWGENSPTNNREAGVIIYGDAAEYFSQVFLFDWDKENAMTGRVTENRTSIIVVVVIVIAAIILFILFSKYRKK